MRARTGLVQLLLAGAGLCACAVVARGESAAATTAANTAEGLIRSSAAPSVTSIYRRGAAAPTLPEDHARLRPSQASRDANLPEQVHLALAGEGQMTVSWVTPRQGGDPLVWYREEEGAGEARDAAVAATAEWRVAAGSNASYSCDVAAGCPLSPLYQSGVIHHAVLTQLLPSTRYVYRFQEPLASGEGADAAAKEYSFTTPPDTGPEVAFKYTLVGDLGQTANSLQTVKHMEESGGGLIVHAGDLSYADGLQPRWDTFATMVEPLAARTAWMVGSGNHEVERDVHPKQRSSQRDVRARNVSFVAYNVRYQMPPVADAAHPPTDLQAEGPNNNFYAFEHGAVTWIMMGSYVNFEPGSTQFRWLQATLKQIDRTRTPWVFATAHAPWYNSNTVHAMEYEGEGMRAAMEALVYSGGVDGVFFGHVHSYERNHPAFQWRRDPCGPVHIVLGDGGNREGIAAPWAEPQPPYSAFREGSFGHGTLQVVNATHAVFDWHRNQDGERVVADTHTFAKRPASFGCEAKWRSAARRAAIGVRSQEQQDTRRGSAPRKAIA